MSRVLYCVPTVSVIVTSSTELDMLIREQVLALLKVLKLVIFFCGT